MKKIEDFNFKKSYIGIFSLNYLAQGLNQSMFTIVIPIYLLVSTGVVHTSVISYMISIIMIPFSIKFLFGLLSDKIGTKNFGRRKPWIIFPSIISGLLWIIMPLFLWLNFADIILIFIISGILIALGVAVSDCGIDGLILDICPQSQLGQTTGFCWAFRSIGIFFGAPISLLFLLVCPIETIFISLGLLIICFSIFTLFIKEIEKNIFQKTNILDNIKKIVRKGENWKVFGFSFFTTIIAGVIHVFLSFYILIQMGLVNPIGARIETLNENITLYEYQACITAIISTGVILGSIIGGMVADKKSRSLCVYLSFGLTTGSLLLILIPIPSTLWYILLIFAVIIGGSAGWINSALSSVISEYSKKYPKTNLTYLSICLSFSNLGVAIGLSMAGIIFSTISMHIANISIIYGTVFILLAIISLLGLIPFSLMDKKQFEYKLMKIKESF